MGEAHLDGVPVPGCQTLKGIVPNAPNVVRRMFRIGDDTRLVLPNPQDEHTFHSGKRHAVPAHADYRCARCGMTLVVNPASLKVVHPSLEMWKACNLLRNLLEGART